MSRTLNWHKEENNTILVTVTIHGKTKKRMVMVTVLTKNVEKFLNTLFLRSSH